MPQTPPPHPPEKERPFLPRMNDGGTLARFGEQLNTATVLTALLHDCSAMSEYRALRDSLPHCLASVLHCRAVMIYLRQDETLQLTAGTFDDQPGWSAALLTLAHINPIDIQSAIPEARAWRELRPIGIPEIAPRQVAVPLIYRQQAIGVLVLVRDAMQAPTTLPASWSDSEIQLLETVAGVVALLLENTRLLERDRERIHELSLLNSISSQMHCSMYEIERLRSIVIQRTREISAVDFCALLETGGAPEALPLVTAELRTLLFQHCHERRSLVPYVVERPGTTSDLRSDDYLNLLPPSIKTFFVLPLLSGRATGKSGGTWLRGSIVPQESTQEPELLGIIAGGYTRPWKLSRAELALLQVLASQASAILENMRLMEEVLEARNETRVLLRQVLEDQRLKELILASIPSGLITTDLEGRITTLNRAAATILGYHPYEVLGLSLHRFLDVRAPESVLPGTSAVAAQEAFQRTVLTLDRFEQEHVLDVLAKPLYGDQGERVGTLTTFSDVTSMHRLEEEKRRLDRLASLGEMAANVAHEVRNPLASIKTSVQMLSDDLMRADASIPEQSNWMQESVQVVLKEVERLDSIVRDLLLFARPRQLHCIRCNLPDLSDQVLKFIQKQYADAGIIVHRLYEQVPPVYVDMGQMEQVLLNLFMNALQAMPEGGIVTVACRCVAFEPSMGGSDAPIGSVLHATGSAAAYLQLRPCDHALQMLEFVVSDTGEGIASDQLERIFQPFYTTRAHGIGLGLSITRRLIEDHGGSIRVLSQLGYGATISMRLPILSDESMQESHYATNDV